ncbi:YncE family protein [Cytobacillus sp. Hm23]
MATFVIDAKSHSVIATIPEGNFPPATFTATPFSGKIAYVINSNSMNDPVISVIDVKTHSVIATIPVGDNTIAVAITPDGKTSYVANAIGNSITVIDIKTHNVVATISTEPTLPFDIAFSPDGKLAYIAGGVGTTNGTITAIDVKTHSVIAILDLSGTSPLFVTFTPDGKLAYVFAVQSSQ